MVRKFPTEVRSVEEVYVKLGGREYRLSEVEEIVDELEDADWAGSRLRIYNTLLEEELEKRKVLVKTQNRGCYRADGYEALRVRIERTREAHVGDA